MDYRISKGLAEKERQFIINGVKRLNENFHKDYEKRLSESREKMRKMREKHNIEQIESVDQDSSFIKKALLSMFKDWFR